ncbi:nuclear transport factor 2 family protein [Pseudonocardia broussonetiae]|uniref:SnoaL-like domain-containing protein n=1 Tax=Pseudonocardia broussonetiae TaxID=2736640 RepID=A0A6M6JU43_9PSEU|nr:nuclear transport factor 2 family protein [Pseudonocardia broussonetiae]QJY49959.1 SnoaL-like domain-containing protein [Pseudonocardia broussonetiae]
MSDHSLADARVEDRALIAAVMHRYAAMAKEEADFTGMAVLYTGDATIRFPDGLEVGPHEMAKVVRGNEPTAIRHHATTIDIAFTGDTEAQVSTMYLAVTDEAAPDHWGRWEDRFVRQPDGRWLISDRSIVVDGAAPGGWLARQYGGG